MLNTLAVPSRSLAQSPNRPCPSSPLRPLVSLSPILSIFLAVSPLRLFASARIVRCPLPSASRFSRPRASSPQRFAALPSRPIAESPNRHQSFCPLPAVLPLFLIDQLTNRPIAVPLPARCPLLAACCSLVLSNRPVAPFAPCISLYAYRLIDELTTRPVRPLPSAFRRGSELPRCTGTGRLRLEIAHGEGKARARLRLCNTVR
jgi:hypothetical protein